VVVEAAVAAAAEEEAAAVEDTVEVATADSKSSPFRW
jgi:hypothetical protein